MPANVQRVVATDRRLERRARQRERFLLLAPEALEIVRAGQEGARVPRHGRRCTKKLLAREKRKHNNIV